MGRSFPANRNFCGESQATDRDAAWNGVTFQQEIAAGVLQYNHEASAKKNDAPQGNSATNAADTTSGLHGYSCRSHSDAFRKNCKKIFLSTGLAPFHRFNTMQVLFKCAGNESLSGCGAVAKPWFCRIRKTFGVSIPMIECAGCGCLLTING